MLNFYNNKNINDGLNYFIMQSNENLEKFLDIYLQLDGDFGESILDNLNLSKKDFTDSDWKIISQYL